MERLLADRTGLSPALVGQDELRRAVRSRQRTLSAPDDERYFARLERDDDELWHLVDLVVVRETWFFREPSAFEGLTDRVRARASSRPFRVLSLPCSTGEEAYSIAITLLSAGLTARTAVVHAADLSRTALAAARAGEYSAHALRQVPPEIRRAYFDEQDGRCRVVDAVKGLVTFRHANLLDPRALAHEAPFDVVFCRNVLIYFGLPARERALASLARLVADEGLLLTGHAEGQRVVAPRFTSARMKGVFAFRKRIEATAVESAARAATHGRGDRSRSGPQPQTAAVEPASTTALSSKAVEPSSLAPPAVHQDVDRGATASRNPWDDIAPLFDAGRFAEAQQQCVQWLARRPDSPDVHFLVGLIASTEGRRAEAERAWRRAIYLDPEHVEALTHLAVERDRRGDAHEAALLRRRAERARRDLEDDG
jgi:chemotaxis protein methyltransferase WspC